MMPNADLAYRVLDLAMAHPAHLNMRGWASGLVGLPELTSESECGTTACYAGWIVAVAGYKVDRDGCVVDTDGYYINPVGFLAMDLLGIDAFTAEDLFFVDEVDLPRVVERIFGPRPTGAS